MQYGDADNFSAAGDSVEASAYDLSRDVAAAHGTAVGGLGGLVGIIHLTATSAFARDIKENVSHFAGLLRRLR